MKRVMLLGATGQVGQALRAEPLPPDWNLKPYGRADADITDHRAIVTAINSFKPDLILNAAAMTAVDLCEKEQEKAVAANFEGPANLAAQCSARDIPLIHISTDYVFDGRQSESPYKPDDQMNPLSIYGNTKMMGEESVRHELAWHVILRISSVFSRFGMNLLTKALQSIETKDELKVVTDQKSCPTPAQDVASGLVHIAEHILSGRSDVFGTFHLCGEGAASRLEFIQAIMDAYAPMTTKRPKITPALTADFPGFAERPAYSALDCTKTRTVFGIRQRPWREGLREAIETLTQDQRTLA